ncbi:TadE/TadG family type IV pilus assembly protein [Tardiphaga sp.]|jgi:Flp pilus assembly protein TadG|uniref:TadE/TadG family type IV pilus assembly protein n=1 Tax=Tardiphaga sp. TaxID=1926292 RepID=UPI0037D9B966
MPILAIARKLRYRAASLRRDDSGIAAIEFAMIAPMLVLMLFGITDVANYFAVDRKVSQIAQTVSDLTSRYTTVQESDVTNFFTVAGAIVNPYDKNALKTTIHQVYLDPSSKTAKVVWSRGSVPLSKNSVYSVPAGLVSKDASGNWLANQYLIVGDVKYNYVPTIGWVLSKTGITASEIAFTKPRQMTCVMLGSTCTPSGG